MNSRSHQTSPDNQSRVNLTMTSYPDRCTLVSCKYAKTTSEMHHGYFQWSSSGLVVVYWWSTSGLLVVHKSSPCGPQVVFKWSPSGLLVTATGLNVSVHTGLNAQRLFKWIGLGWMHLMHLFYEHRSEVLINIHRKQ